MRSRRMGWAEKYIVRGEKGNALMLSENLKKEAIWGDTNRYSK